MLIGADSDKKVVLIVTINGASDDPICTTFVLSSENVNKFYNV